jgi:hypothetical protein
MSEKSEMLPKSVEASPTLKTLAPCLRSHSENRKVKEPRKVSFPEEDGRLVTGYLEPANPWEFGKPLLHLFLFKQSILVRAIRLTCRHLSIALIKNQTVPTITISSCKYFSDVFV